MSNKIHRMIDGYPAWLADRTSLRPLEDGWVEVTTPFLDRHNDSLQIYVREGGNGKYTLTDDGYVIGDLGLSGCELKTAKRRALLETTLNGFGVRLEEDALTVDATAENFPWRKHSLVQAMLAVDDMFYLARSTVESLFYEDVRHWLDDGDIRYVEKVKFSGRSGYDHVFDFAIPKSRTQPQRVVRVMTRPTRESALGFIGAWQDTQQGRKETSQPYAILNDTEKPVPSGVQDALSGYEITAVPWSQREQYREELAA